MFDVSGDCKACNLSPLWNWDTFLRRSLHILRIFADKTVHLVLVLRQCLNFRWSGEIFFNIVKLSYMSSTEPQCRLQSDGMMPHKAAMKLWLNLVFHCWVQMKPGPGPSLDVSQRPYKHINWRCEPNNIQILLSSWGWLRPVPGDNTRNETIIIIITILILVNVWSIKLVHLLDDISALIGIYGWFQKLLI